MSASIFVDDKNTFDVEVYYKVHGKDLKVLDKKEEGCDVLKVKFRHPNFSATQKVLSASTSFDPSGNPNVDIVRLRNNLLLELIESWDAKDADGKETIPTPEMIGKVHTGIASALINKMQEHLGEDGFSLF